MSITIQDFDFSVNLLRAILWEYDNSPKLVSLLQSKSDWYTTNQEEFWEDWATNIFDLRTANDFGLSVWAIILGVPLQTTIAPITKINFGFGTHNKNFNNGTFGAIGSTNVNLTTDQKRLLLQLRHFKLVSRCTIPSINRMLSNLLGNQIKMYALDPLNMKYIIYVFSTPPSSQLSFILKNFDVLPRPAAVGIKFRVATAKIFGFGTHNKNFNNGSFSS